MIPEFSTTAPRDGFRSDTATPPATIPCDALVVFVTDDAPAGGAAAEIDRATGGLLGRLAAAGEITGKRYECTPILAPAGIAAGQLLVVGLGSKAGLDQGTLYRAAAAATRLLAGRRRASVAPGESLTAARPPASLSTSRPGACARPTTCAGRTAARAGPAKTRRAGRRTGRPAGPHPRLRR